MQHLNPETLARLVDEIPEPAEQQHLDACAVCCAELRELRAQTEALAALSPLQAPAGEWQALEARLTAEGLISEPEAPHWRSPAAAANRPGRWTHRFGRIAAALALFAAGGASGAAMVGSGIGSGAEVVADAGQPGIPGVGSATTAEDAAATLRAAEDAYLAALTHYTELTGGAQPVDAATRLAALEGIVLTTRAALDEAPADPVINGYHLAALGQRDAMLRQIARQPDDPWF